MANRNCVGMFFIAAGRPRYWCRWDGSVIDVEEPDGSYQMGQGMECRQCGRPIKAESFGHVPVQSRVLHQARLPNGSVLTYEAELIDGRAVKARS